MAYKVISSAFSSDGEQGSQRANVSSFPHFPVLKPKRQRSSILSSAVARPLMIHTPARAVRIQVGALFHAGVKKGIERNPTLTDQMDTEDGQRRYAVPPNEHSRLTLRRVTAICD
jgi:hypothetical protein